MDTKRVRESVQENFTKTDFDSLINSNGSEIIKKRILSKDPDWEEIISFKNNCIDGINYWTYIIKNNYIGTNPNAGKTGGGIYLLVGEDYTKLKYECDTTEEEIINDRRFKKLNEILFENEK